MNRYSKFIDAANLISNVETTLTTGDLEYGGTAFEITDGQSGRELFHIVADENGERQLLVFGCDGNFRISLSTMEEIISSAKGKVNRTVGGE